MATLAQNIQRAINDFNSIENAIVLKGVPVPDGTPTSEYGEKILSIESGVDTSGDTVVPSALREGYTAHDAAGQEITGTIPNYDGSITEGAVPGAQAKYEEGVEDGKQEQYDAFWDNAQESGNRKYYESFCSNVFYPSEILRKPKYPVVIVGNADRFMESFNTPYSTYGKSIGASPLDGSSLSIDASGATSAISFLANCSVENLFVDLSNATDLRNAFSNGNGVAQSDKIIIKVSEKCTAFEYIFNYQYLNGKTDVLRFAEGSVIAAVLNLARAYQSKEGIISTVNALSTTTTGLTVTLRLAAVNTAFETAQGSADGSSSEEWLNLIATKPNWTINLINS